MRGLLTKNAFVEGVGKQTALVARARAWARKRVVYKHIFCNAPVPLGTAFRPPYRRQPCTQKLLVAVHLARASASASAYASA